MENFETFRLDQTGQQTQAILDQVSTNTADIAQLRALYEALTLREPVIIQPSDTWPVADPQENVIYRVIDRVNTPPQYYSDYMWNGTAMVLMATYNNSIDNEPTPGSNNFVKSGGVAASIVFDISAYHATGSTLATYADLAAALGTDGANVPASVRKGGMSVKFVNSSDNKYVQYRLMADSFTPVVTEWQGVDEEPTAGSDNLVKSGGVYSNLYLKARVNIQEVTSFDESPNVVDTTYKTGIYAYGQKINENPYYSDSTVNVLYENNTVRAIMYCFLEVTEIGVPANYRAVALFDANNNLIYESSHTGKILVEVPRGCKLLARTTAIHPFNNYDGGLGAFNVMEVFNKTLKTHIFDLKQVSNGIAKYYVESTLTGIWRTMDKINATPVGNSTKYFKYKNEENNAINVLFKTNFEIGAPQAYRTFAIYDGNDNLVYTSYMQGMFSVTLPAGHTIIASADSYMYSTGSDGSWVESLDRTEKEWYNLKRTIIAWGATKYITSSSTYGTIIVNVPYGVKKFLFNGIDYSENTGSIILMSSFPNSNVINSSVIETLGATSGKFYDLPEGVRYISIPYGISNNPNVESLFFVSFGVNAVKCIGDSLTQSVVDGLAGRWEIYLQELYNNNFLFLNYGAGGENVGTIFARTGLLPMQIASDVAIPAESQEVNITIKNVYNQVLLPFIQGELRNGAQVIINGVQGLMKGTMTGIHTAQYTFQRNTNGDAVTFKDGDYIFVVNTESIRKGDDAVIIWVGQNGGYSINETSRYQGDPTNEGDVTRLVNMIKSALTVLNPSKYIVVSPPQNTADLLENSFMMAFGGNYFNVRQYLVNRGIDIAKQNEWFDDSYPTAQDIADMANGIVPTSLRQDEVHFNLIGYKVFALGIKEMMDLQWVV